MTRASTKCAASWSGAAWSGRWPGCDRSRCCTEEKPLTPQWTSPGERWRLLAPEGAVAVEVSPRPRGIRRAVAELRALPGGTPVVLLDYRPGGPLRARRPAPASAVGHARPSLAAP